jgi:hypothetical protein
MPPSVRGQKGENWRTLVAVHLRRIYGQAASQEYLRFASSALIAFCS